LIVLTKTLAEYIKC